MWYLRDMKRFIITVVAISVFASGTVQAGPYGGYGHYGHGGGYHGGYYGGYGHGYYGGYGWGWGGLPVAAFATGALLTSAYYSQPYYYYDGGPSYYDDPPVYRTHTSYQSSSHAVAVPRSGLDLDVQTALRSRGYYMGSLDGVYGPQTADAIRRFQTDNGLALTGKINGDTLKALGL